MGRSLCQEGIRTRYGVRWIIIQTFAPAVVDGDEILNDADRIQHTKMMSSIISLYVWNAMKKSKTTGTNAGRNIGLLACNMYLKYVGKDFSMGLRTGQTYKVKVLSKDHYIWVEWGFCNVCPYDSPGSFAKNWIKP